MLNFSAAYSIKSNSTLHLSELVGVHGGQEDAGVHRLPVPVTGVGQEGLLAKMMLGSRDSLSLCLS